ncbi:MAG: cobalt-precorrin 5A hydrolase [Lachnospiraceae bacterium]|nr:cobalt-precorrin 5A hydrolase [Lachnospiraceae bacterium]
MKLLIVSFTKRGEELADKLQIAFDVIQIPSRIIKGPFVPTLGEQIGESFRRDDGIIFVGATGIAVRTIAPYLKSKYTDPAVVVLDERAQYCISLLSGHVGGANALARQVASLTGASPVITTATDVNDCFAIDLYARQKDLYMDPVKMCKKISASLLNGEKVLLKSDFPILSSLPNGMELEGAVEEGEENLNHIHFSLFSKGELAKNTLYLLPRILTIGIGCRRGASYEKIENAVVQSMMRLGSENHHSVKHMLQSTLQIASIDLKKDEIGIRQFAEKYRLPFLTFSAEELEQAPGEFSHSDFVNQTAGVDNVCERAAMKACGTGKLIHKKTVYDGVTIAIAMADWSVDFV